MTLTLKNDVVCLIVENFVNQRAIRALQSFVKFFTRRIKIDKYQRFAFDHIQDKNRLLTTLMIQIIRIDDFFARHVNQ